MSITEFEYTVSFEDIDKTLFDQLKNEATFFERRYNRKENDSRFQNLNLPHNIHTFKNYFFKPNDNYLNCQLRRIEQFNDIFFIPGVSALRSVVQQLKIVLHIETFFATFENDLFPILFKQSIEQQLEKKDIDLFPIVHDELNTVCYRWGYYIDTQVKDQKIRVTMDKIEHYTKHVMYTVNFEMECDKNLLNYMNFVDTLRNQKLLLQQLFIDVSKQPSNIVSFITTKISRPFGFLPIDKSTEDTQITYYSKKIDGVRSMGILSNKGILIFTGEKVIFHHVDVPIKQKYLISIEYLSPQKFKIIDVNVIIRHKFNFYKSFHVHPYMFEYIDIKYDVSILAACAYINNILKKFLPCNIFFDTEDDAQKHSLSCMDDGLLAFADNMIYKIKKFETIDLQFCLNKFIDDVLIIFKNIQSNNARIIVKQLKTKKFHNLSLFINLQTWFFRKMYRHFYSREKKKISKIDCILLKIPIDPIKFLENLKVTKESNIINNFAVVEFECAWCNKKQKMILSFKRFRNDRFVADSNNSIIRIFSFVKQKSTIN